MPSGDTKLQQSAILLDNSVFDHKLAVLYEFQYIKVYFQLARKRMCMEILGWIPCDPSTLLFTKKKKKKESIKSRSRHDEQRLQETRRDLISLKERQVEAGCQAATRDGDPFEVNLNFQRNPIKTAALKRQTLAGHLLCNTASVQEKIGYFLTMTPGEIGPGCCGYYKSQRFLLCGGNVESALTRRLFVYLLGLFS